MTIVTIKIKPVLIEPDGIHLLIPANVQDEELFFILDTGASQSIFNIDAEVFESIDKLEPDDERKSSGINAPLSGIQSGTIPSLDMGGYNFADVETYFMPFQHINSLYLEFINFTVDGIVGGDFLSAYDAIIDYSKMELRLHV